VEAATAYAEIESVERSQDQVVGVFSRAAPMYESVGPRHFSYFAERLVEFVGVEAGDHVLDVATGTGAVLFAVRERTGERGRVVGIDVTPAMLARARATVEHGSLLNVELHEMDGEQLAFPDEAFDRVFCSFGLQAFPDARLALVGFRRVLRRGGRVGVVLPKGWPFECEPRWGWQADVLRSFGCQLEAPDEELRPSDLLSSLESSGFADIEMADVGCSLEFRNEDEWWSWSWSHGTRSLFEQVPVQRLPALRDEMINGMAACRSDDGRIRGVLPAMLARATKPV